MSAHTSNKNFLSGEFRVPGDKSITHRAILFSALATSKSRLRTNVLGRDNFASLRVMRELGVGVGGVLSDEMYSLAKAERVNEGIDRGAQCELIVDGKGLGALRKPSKVLDCGNSGTTARLLSGILAGLPFESTIDGDSSLRRRPFKRVVDPLSEMGARFSGERLPISVVGSELSGVAYDSPRASAQVKSAILLAGLSADGAVRVSEPFRSRDHTERMFRAMGVDVIEAQEENGRWSSSLPEPTQRVLHGADFEIPGDFSSAAFLIALATVLPDSDIVIRNVGVNPTRVGFLEVLRRMGAKFDLENQRESGGEPVADIVVTSAELRGTEIDEADVVLAIDEVPLLSFCAAFADGTTRITGASELRVKESDRLQMTELLLTSFGAEVQGLADGLVITGRRDFLERAQADMSHSKPKEFAWKNSGDHRIAMIGAILERYVLGQVDPSERASVETSFPGFFEIFR